jgi:uncharacterized SAM-binding protein YcdF (DUF218 family)
MGNIFSNDKLKIISELCLIAGCCLIFIGFPSSVFIRTWLAAPLVIHDQNARGEACYVLAGGYSTWERLGAGTDLINDGRVATLLIMNDDSAGPYNFQTQSNWTKTQWMVDYMNWHGVPVSKIKILEPVKGFFGTFSEARMVAKQLPQNIKTLVVVSSPAHMRRVTLAFRRALPSDVKVIPYSASCFETSSEMWDPIWIEYFKLFVYFIFV